MGREEANLNIGGLVAGGAGSLPGGLLHGGVGVPTLGVECGGTLSAKAVRTRGKQVYNQQEDRSVETRRHAGRSTARKGA